MTDVIQHTSTLQVVALVGVVGLVVAATFFKDTVSEWATSVYNKIFGLFGYGGSAKQDENDVGYTKENEDSDDPPLRLNDADLNEENQD